MSRRRIAAAVVAAVSGPPVAQAQTRPPKPAHARPTEVDQARAAARPYAPTVRETSNRWGLPPHLLEALLWRESRFRPDARHKRTKARGIGQFVPSGAAAVGRIQRERGVSRWFTYARAADPIASIYAAAEFVAFLLDLCGGLSEAIGGYNSGRCGSNAFSRSVLRLADWLRAAEEPRT